MQNFQFFSAFSSVGKKSRVFGVSMLATFMGKLLWERLIRLFSKRSAASCLSLSKKSVSEILHHCSSSFEARSTSLEQLSNIHADIVRLDRKPGDHKDVEQVSGLCFYLPNHSAFEEGTTTKLRVVFDASSKSANGDSQNNWLLLCSRLQIDIFDIFLRFRPHQHALSADVVALYR